MKSIPDINSKRLLGNTFKKWVIPIAKSKVHSPIRHRLYRRGSSGFAAISSQSKSDPSEIVISFAGTNNVSLGDDWSDHGK